MVQPNKNSPINRFRDSIDTFADPVSEPNFLQSIGNKANDLLNNLPGANPYELDAVKEFDASTPTSRNQAPWLTTMGNDANKVSKEISGTAGAGIGGAVAAPIMLLDYGTRVMNTAVATTALTAEYGLSGSKSSVPYLRDGVDLDDIGRLIGDTYGDNIDVENINGTVSEVQNSITAGQGISTLIGRGGFNFLSRVIPGIGESMDEKIEKESFDELNVEGNDRKLYSWLTGLYSDFDITNYKERESAYNQGLGRWITGTADAAIQWYVGVDVIAMKGAGLAGRTLFMRNIDSFGDVNKMTDELVAHDAWQKGLAQGEILDIDGNVVRTIEAKKTEMGRLADTFVKMNERQILKHKIASSSDDNLLVARILGKAKSYEEVQLGLRAMSGDMAAVDQLLKADAIAGDALALKSQHMSDLKGILDMTPLSPLERANQQWAGRRLGELDSVYEQALKENESLANMVAAISRDSGMSTVSFNKVSLSKLEYGPNSPARMMNQAEKAARRDQGLGLWGSTTFKAGGTFGRTIRVMHSPIDYMKTSRQNGRIDLTNSKDVVDEIDSIFQVTPFFRRMAKISPDAIMPGTNETITAFRTRMYDDAINAPTASARWEVMQRLDASVTKAISMHYAIDPEDVVSIVDKYKTMRTGLLEQVQRHGYFEDNGDIIAVPQLKDALAGLDMQSKKAETFFATDFNFLETVFRLEKGSATRRKATSLGMGFDTAYSMFDSVWRPLVLMRLGYTQRNVAEGWLRELAAFGTLGAMKDRRMGTSMNEQDSAFIWWASSFGNAVNSVKPSNLGSLRPSTVRRRIKQLDTAREQSVASGQLANEAQGSLTAIENLAVKRSEEIRKIAQERVARANKAEMDRMVGEVWENADTEARGDLTEMFDNSMEVMIPSSQVRPLLSPFGRSARRSKTMSAFESSDDAMMRGVNDESIPKSTTEDFMGVKEDLGVADQDSAITKFMSKSESEEFLSIRAASLQGGIEDSQYSRWMELYGKAQVRAASQAMEDGHKVVRVLDSGLYQIVHSADEIDVTDIDSGNLAIVLKEDFGKATAFRANVAGDAVDLRFKPVNLDEAAQVVEVQSDADRITELHRSIFGADNAHEWPAKSAEIADIAAVLKLAESDPQLAQAISLRQMVDNLPEDAQEWFKANGLLMESSRLKRLAKKYTKQEGFSRNLHAEVELKRQQIVDMVNDFDWDEFAEGDIPLFHGGSRIKNDELAEDPINNVVDQGAVFRGVGFYSTENPNIGVDYIVNRALNKDGEPVFYATAHDPNINKALDLNEVVESYEAEDELKRIFSRMQEKYGDEADFDTAWEEVDGTVRDNISNAQFDLQGDGEVLPADVNQFREAMAQYFQMRIADDVGYEVTFKMMGNRRVVDRTDGWADTEYQAQMLWVDSLREEGYDGITHLGGVNSGGPEHQVFIWYVDPGLTRIDEISDEALALRSLMQKSENAGQDILRTVRENGTRLKVAPYDGKQFDASSMTRYGEQLLGKYMNQTGKGRIYVNDSLSPSGYRLIVNPDMVSVNTDQLDAVLPGSMVSKDYADRTLEALQQEAMVRNPQVWVPSNIDDAVLLDEFGGDTAVLDFLRTGRGNPETKAKVARYMETRQGIGESLPYTHVEVGGKGKFVSVSEMLGNGKVGAAYKRTLDGDEVDETFTFLANNDEDFLELQQKMGTLRQETQRTADKFLADQEAAKAAADRLRKRLGRRGAGRQVKKKMGSGEEVFAGNFEEFMTDGVFNANNQGVKNASEAGSDRRVQMELYGFTDRSQRMMRRTSTPKTYKPAEREYWNTFTDEINKIWRNDPVGEMLFKGMDVEDIYSALRLTDRGRAWIRDVAGISDFRGRVSKDILNENAEQAILTEIADRQSILSRLLPAADDAERARIYDHISTHDVTPNWLRTELGWRSDLQSLEGFGVQYEMGKNWRSFTSKTMQVLGTLPENALVRHPFYRARWREEMQRQADIYAPQISARNGGGPAQFTDAQINTMNMVAKKRALRQVNDTLYTIQRVSTPAHMFRFVIPFFPAWASSMKFWLLRMPVEKPETLARYGLAFNAPEAIGIVRDDQGNPVKDANVEGNLVPSFVERIGSKFTSAKEGQLVIQLTPGVAKSIQGLTGGQSSLSVSKGSLDMLLQGEHFWVPGLGPLVTIGASWLGSLRPDIATEIETGNFSGFSKFIPAAELQKALYGAALPFGPTKEKSFVDAVAENILPATASRLYQITRGEDSASFSNASMSIYQTDIIDWELSGRQGEAPNFLDATDKAGDFFRFRSLVSATAPAALGFNSKYKFYIDEWRRMESAAFEEGGGGLDAAQDEFIRKYGKEFFAATMSLSGGSSGISSSVGEYKEFDKNPQLMASLATYGDDASYITMATRPFARALNEDGFDPAVYAWQYNRKVDGASGKYLRTGSSNREDMLLDVDKENGWWMFDNATDQLDSLLATEAIDEDTYSALKSAAANKIGAKYQGWWKEYNGRGDARYIDSVRAMDDILSNEKYMSENGEEPYIQSMEMFNSGRNQLVQMLVANKVAGGSDNIDAKQNAGIAFLYETLIKKSIAIDPSGEFERMHRRFFGSDKLKPIPGRDK